MSETSPELYLGCQMMTPVYEVVGGGQSCQMQHWDRVKPVLLLHECRLSEGGHSGHEGGLSQCRAVGDKLIEKLHTDCELSDDPQAAHIQCVQRVLIERTGSKQAESSLKFHNQVWPFLGVVEWRLSSILVRNQRTWAKCWQWVYIWPWKLKVKVKAKVKPDGHIWALEFNRYVCFSFRGNRTIFGRDNANSIFDLGNWRSRSWPRSNPMVTFEP